MDLLGVLILLILCLVPYLIVARNKNQVQTVPPLEYNKIIQQEEKRKQEIIEKIDVFLKSALFVEPIAVWNGQDIYKYVCSEGYLYEFKDTMSDNSQRIGMDEEYLCFKKLCYQRVENPVDFMQKHGQIIDIKEV